MWPQVRAALVLAAAVFLLVMGFPGLDFFQSDPKRASTPVRKQLVALDVALRRPLVEPLEPVERFLGMNQRWHFYTTGASRTRRLELRVDGEVWHRSNHPEHRFRAAQLANPRLRHHTKNWVRGKSGSVTHALMAWAIAEVLTEKPDAQHVEMRGLEGRWPGRKLRIVRSAEASAPDWTVRRTKR